MKNWSHPIMTLSVVVLFGLLYPLSVPASISPKASSESASGQEYILVLDHVEPNFISQLAGTGASPVREIGLLFLVRMKASQAEQVTKIAGVQRVMPATSVVIEMQPEVHDLSVEVENLEGIVTQHYQKINAIGAVIPVIRMPDLLKVRGVKRVTKQSFSRVMDQH